MIPAFLSGMTFLHPWVLGALAALPVLWWILRLMPPAPKHILFAPIRFLKDLIPERQTPRHTPWWILLLRCLIVTLIILALAGPVRGPVETVDASARIRIVIDNGWASASLWDTQIRRAEDIISRADSGQSIEIAATALPAGRDTPLLQSPMAAGEAKTFLRTLTPLPWPANNKALLDKLQENDAGSVVHTYWLGDGIDENHFKALADELQAQGKLFYFRPAERDLPLALRFDADPEQNLRFSVDAPGTAQTAKGRSIEAVSTDGRILDRQALTFSEGGADGRATFDIPADLRVHLAKVRIVGRQDTGSTYMFDDMSRRRNVGIITSKDIGDTKPFLDALFYLTRALSPYADITTGDVDTLIDKGQDVLILTDGAALPPAVLEELQGWLERGGLILRFAGPDMKDMENLTPVPLRGGQRALEGNLSWERPQKLAAFPKDSPLADIGLREEITVKSQVLADPAFDLTGKVWAALEDGTPLITADARGKGLLIMVHTAADPSWSDLPLSGVYVQMLRRMIMLSGAQATDTPTGDLQAVSVMDGYGTLRAASNEKPIAAGDFPSLVPNHHQPPGFYGRGGYTQALNLGDRIPALRVIPSLPAGASEKAYDGAVRTDYAPFLLAAALALFLIDWVLLLMLSGSLRALKWKHAAIILMLALPLPAQAGEKEDILHAGDIYMAYVKTGQPTLDDTTEKGLGALSRILEQRTSITPGGVIAVDPERDDLSFYPFIYWPIAEGAGTLSDKAILNIQHYLDHGGTILFDTRGRTTNALQALIHPLAVPALTPIEKDHVLNKTFYLIESYPGRYNERQLWIEENSAAGRDGVSSIIIGSNDWASAWASLPGADGGPAYITGATRQEELALRFGVNFVMYALTGNYKADQVHLPHILQRLDQ